MKLCAVPTLLVCSALLVASACQSSPRDSGLPVSAGSGVGPAEPAVPEVQAPGPPTDCFFGDEDPSCSWLSWVDGRGSAPAEISATGIHRWSAAAVQVSGDCASWSWPLALRASVDQPLDWRLPEAAAVYSAALRTSDASLTLGVADIMSSWPVEADSVRLAVVDRLPMATPVDVLIPDTTTLTRLRAQIRSRLLALHDPRLQAAGLARLVWPWSASRTGGAAAETLLRETTHELLRGHVRRGGLDAHTLVLQIHTWAAWLAVRTGPDARVMLLRSLEQALTADLAAAPIWSIPLELQLVHSVAGLVQSSGSPSRSVSTAADTLMVIGTTLDRIEQPAESSDPALQQRWELSPVLPPLLLIALPGSDEALSSQMWNQAMESLTSRDVPAAMRIWLNAQWSGLQDARREGRVFEATSPPAEVLTQYPGLADALFEWFMVVGRSMALTSWCGWEGPSSRSGRWMALALDGWLDCGDGGGVRRAMMGASQAAVQQTWDEEVERRCNEAVAGMPDDLDGTLASSLQMLGAPRALRVAVAMEGVDGWYMGGAQTAWLPGVGAPLGAPLGNRTVGPRLRLPSQEQWRLSMSRDALRLMTAMLHLSPLTVGPGVADALLANRTTIELPAGQQARALQSEGFLFTAADLDNARLALLGVRERSDGETGSTLAFRGQVNEGRQLDSRSLGISPRHPLLQSLRARIIAWSGGIGDPGMADLQARELYEALSIEGMHHEADGLLRFYCQALSEQQIEGAVGHCAHVVENAMSVRLPSTVAGLDAVELATRHALVSGRSEWATQALGAALREGRASLSDGRYSELLLLLLQVSVESESWSAAADTAAQLETVFRWQGPEREALAMVFRAMHAGCVWMMRGEVDIDRTAGIAASAATVLEADLGQTIRDAWAPGLGAEERDERILSWLRAMFDTESEPFWRRQPLVETP